MTMTTAKDEINTTTTGVTSIEEFTTVPASPKGESATDAKHRESPDRTVVESSRKEEDSKEEKACREAHCKVYKSPDDAARTHDERWRPDRRTARCGNLAESYLLL
jgi:hypothetical protein